MWWFTFGVGINDDFISWNTECEGVSLDGLFST